MPSLMRNWKRTLVFTLTGGALGFILSMLYIRFGST